MGRDKYSVSGRVGSLMRCSVLPDQKNAGGTPALRGDNGIAGREGQQRTGGGGFFADIGEADGVGLLWKGRGTGDGADFFGVRGENCAGGGRLACLREAERDAAAVYLAAGADALDDFLAGVAAFRVADVGVFETGFVGDLFIAEVVAEPGNLLFEAEGVEGFVADGAAARGPRFFCDKIPELFDVFAFSADVGGWRIGEGLFYDGAGDRVDVRFDAGEVVERVEIDIGG